MIPRRSLAVAATTATALSLAVLPGVAFAAPIPAAGSASPHATHHALRPVVRHATRHAVRHGNATRFDGPTDNNVTATVSALPDSIAAGSPTNFSVTYTNDGDTDYPVSGLAVDVVDSAQGSALTPASFTLSYQYNGQAAAWGSCEQESTDDGSGDVSCYLDPGDNANSELAPGASVTVQAQLTFTSTYEADDASVVATPVMYTDEDGTQEVDGVAAESNAFEVYTQ